jgi:allophanate hydrolase subunit 1
VRRRTEPRVRVARGAIGLAGGFSCVYPRASPGGWRLIGYTPVSTFDLSRDEPALLQPGMSVDFVRASH